MQCFLANRNVRHGCGDKVIHNPVRISWVIQVDESAGDDPPDKQQNIITSAPEMLQSEAVRFD